MNNKYLLAVVGTQNTGKTTFIKDIMEAVRNNGKWHEFRTNKVDYRKKIEAEGLQINRNGNLRCQNIIFNCLAESLFDAVMDDDVRNFISDRSIIDAFVYTKYLYLYGNCGITEDDIETMYNKLTRLVGIYDDIIYIPLKDCDNVQVVDDKFRDTNLEYRKRIDDLFNETLSRLNESGYLQFTSITDTINGTRDERVQKFLQLKKNTLEVK